MTPSILCYVTYVPPSVELFGPIIHQFSNQIGASAGLIGLASTFLIELCKSTNSTLGIHSLHSLG